MKNILVTFPGDMNYTPGDEARLRAAYPDGEFVFSNRSELTDGQIAAADVWIGNADFDQLAKATQLRWMQLCSAGADYYCARTDELPEGITITNATGAYGLSISEYMMGTLLMMMRNLHLYRDQQNAVTWKRLGRVDSVHGARVLIVGLGDIGTQFARRTEALGAYNVGIKRNLSERPGGVEELYTLDSLDEELTKADVVALSLPSTGETRGLLDEARLRRMKPGSYLINVGRGDAVDGDALARVLRDGPLKAAALDVTAPEPLPQDHPLWTLPNAVITPHCSGNYDLEETVRRIIDIVEENLRNYAAGKPLRNVVDLEAGYAN